MVNWLSFGSSVRKKIIPLLVAISFPISSWPAWGVEAGPWLAGPSPSFFTQAIIQPTEFSGTSAIPRRAALMVLAGAIALVRDGQSQTASETSKTAAAEELTQARTAIASWLGKPSDPNSIASLSGMSFTEPDLDGKLLIWLARTVRNDDPYTHDPAEEILSARLTRSNTADILLFTLVTAPSSDIDVVRLIETLYTRLIREADHSTRKALIQKLMGARLGALVRADTVTAEAIDKILTDVEETKHSTPTEPSKIVRKLFPPFVRAGGHDAESPEKIQQAYRKVLHREVTALAQSARPEELLKDPAAIQALVRLSRIQGEGEDRETIQEIQEKAAGLLHRVWALVPALRGDSLAYGVKLGIIPPEEVINDSTLPPAAQRAIMKAALPLGLPLPGVASSDTPGNSPSLIVVPVGAYDPSSGRIDVTARIELDNKGLQPQLSGVGMTLTPPPGMKIVDIQPSSEDDLLGKQLQSSPLPDGTWRAMVIGDANGQLIVNPTDPNLPVIQMKVTLAVMNPMRISKSNASFLKIVMPEGTTPQGTPVHVEAGAAPSRIPFVSMLENLHNRILYGPSPIFRAMSVLTLLDAIVAEVAALTTIRSDGPGRLAEHLRALSPSVLEVLRQAAQESAIDPRVLAMLDTAKAERQLQDTRDQNNNGLSPLLHIVRHVTAMALNACDLAGKGFVDFTDVATIIAMWLGKIPCTVDIKGPGVCTIDVVQTVIDAATGGPCNTSTLVHYTVLSWTASVSAGVVGYNVYAGTLQGGPYSKINSTPIVGTGFIDYAVIAGNTKYYVLTAADANGNESAHSVETYATTPTTFALLPMVLSFIARRASFLAKQSLPFVKLAAAS